MHRNRVRLLLPKEEVIGKGALSITSPTTSSSLLTTTLPELPPVVRQSFLLKTKWSLVMSFVETKFTVVDMSTVALRSSQICGSC